MIMNDHDYICNICKIDKNPKEKCERKTSSWIDLKLKKKIKNEKKKCVPILYEIN